MASSCSGSSKVKAEDGRNEDLDSILKALREDMLTLSQRQQRLELDNSSLADRLTALERPLKASVGGGSNEEADDCDGAAEAETSESSDLLEYTIGSTLWEAPAFIGLPQLGVSSSVILCFSMLVNCTIQVFLCVMLLQSEDFMDTQRFLSLRKEMQDWRLTSGHSMAYLDATGRSLASRVCSKDTSLTLGDRQVNILSEIDSYLGGRPDPEVLNRPTGTGPWLCVVCTVYFLVLVVCEFRSIATLAQALHSLPLGRTRIEGLGFVSMSPSRRAFLAATNLLRAAIAVVLLCTGVVWLSTTTSVTDLILNAAALGFVLDTDETLFAATAPSRAHLLLDSLKPLKYRRLRWSWEAIVPLVILLLGPLLSYHFLVAHTIADMRNLRQDLCGQQLDFVSTRNPAGYVMARQTAQTQAEFGQLARANGEIMEAPVFGPGMPIMQFSKFFVEEMSTSFAKMATENVEAVAAEFECKDQDDGPGGLNARLYPWRFTAARYEMRVHAGSSMLEEPFRCAAYFPYCNRSDMLRSICPVTCGCDDPQSGLLRATSSSGCPSQCLSRRQARLESIACEDPDLVGSAQWLRYLGDVAGFMSNTIPEIEVRKAWDALIQRKLAQGCANNETAPVAGHSFCSDSGIFRQNGLSSMSALCPASCCTGPTSHKSSDCPPACNAAEGR